jgi:TPR repeat protein
MVEILNSWTLSRDRLFTGYEGVPPDQDRFCTGYEGVPPDNATAAKWLKKAASKGLVDSIFILGEWHTVNYAHPMPFDRNLENEIAWIAKASTLVATFP